MAQSDENRLTIKDESHDKKDDSVRHKVAFHFDRSAIYESTYTEKRDVFLHAPQNNTQRLYTRHYQEKSSVISVVEVCGTSTLFTLRMLMPDSDPWRGLGQAWMQSIYHDISVIGAESHSYFSALTAC